MENPTYIALSRLVAQQRTMDVIANNISNANTPGYKTEHVLFSDWLVRTHAKAGASPLAFTQDRATWRDQAQGAISHTGDPLDLAIGTQGFFSVKTSDGVRLTRAGRFTLSSDGTISDSNGNQLLDDQGSPLVVGSADSQLTVSGDGTLSSEHGRIGKIGVVQPSDPNRIFAEGNHLFRSDSQTTSVSTPGVIQGAVENSNVSPMSEFTNMTELSKDFQYVTQFVESEAQRQQTTIDRLFNFSGES